jgi:ankyrin repeat protein
LDVVVKSKWRKLDISNLFPETESVSQQSMSRTYNSVLSEERPDGMLHQAVSSCDVSQVEKILSDDLSTAQTKDRCGRTPLHLAVNNCNRHLGSYESKDKAMDGRSIITMLARHSTMSATDKWGFTAMDYALYNHDTLSQIELLEHGAKLDAQRHENISILLEYAYEFQKLRAVAALRQLGADDLEAYSLIVRDEYPTTNFDDFQQEELGSEAPQKRKFSADDFETGPATANKRWKFSDFLFLGMKKYLSPMKGA